MEEIKSTIALLPLQGRIDGNVFVSFSKHIMLPVLLAITIMAVVGKYGNMFINRPQLRPDLSQTWK